MGVTGIMSSDSMMPAAMSMTLSIRFGAGDVRTKSGGSS